MLTPLLGLVLGIATVLYAVSTYTGTPLLKPIPVVRKQKGNLIWATGWILVAVALMLGIVGYLAPINAVWLRSARRIIGAIGLLLISYQLGKNWFDNSLIKQRILKASSQWQQQVRRYWELLNVLVPRNLKVRYRGSFLGVYWSLLSPLIMTGLYTAIFGAAFASYYGNSIFNYVLAAFTGLVVINFFSAATTQALSSVVGNGALLNKIRLPMSIFPVSMIIANAFQFAVGILPLLLVVTLLFSKSLVNVLALFLPLIALVLVSAGVGFLVSALFVFFRDLPYFYELVVFVIWISSPIFYPADIVPAQIKPLLALNPLSPIIESIRQIALSGAFPNFSLIWGALLSGVIVLFLGWACFHWWRSQFMDLL